MKSQNDQILAHLKKGKTITPLQALKLFECWALSSRVSDLHKRGIDVKTEIVKGNKKHYAKYYL